MGIRLHVAIEAFADPRAGAVLERSVGTSCGELEELGLGEELEQANVQDHSRLPVETSCRKPEELDGRSLGRVRSWWWPCVKRCVEVRRGSLGRGEGFGRGEVPGEGEVAVVAVCQTVRGSASGKLWERGRLWERGGPWAG